jgi:hypothetical protein
MIGQDYREMTSDIHFKYTVFHPSILLMKKINEKIFSNCFNVSKLAAKFVKFFKLPTVKIIMFKVNINFNSIFRKK